MAQFRTTADILDLALQKAGEVTSGTSPYETQALDYLNRVHFALIAGGTIPIGKDASVQIDEVWPWSRSKKPLILELEPKYDTGSITLTNDSEAGTFSTAPTDSLVGWYLREDGHDEVYRIAKHTAGGTAFEFDSHYLGTTGSSKTFKTFKLDYDLIDEHIVIDVTNNKLQFQETAGTTLTATLTSGLYTGTQLATQVQTQLNATGGTPAYTVSYDTLTKKFTIASDRAGGAVFILVGTGSQTGFSAHKTLGFDDENTTNAASITSTYILSGICRLIEPFSVCRGTSREGNIYGLDPETFQRDYPFPLIDEGLPSRFTLIKELSDGSMTVRFNRYPTESTRVEINYVPIPRDLKDNTSSTPRVPRKHVDVLEDACVFYLMLDKSDDRAQTYAQLLQGKLNAMISQNRGLLIRAGKHFGQIIARPDLISARRRRLTYGENF